MRKGETRPAGEKGPEPGFAWIIRTADMDAILRSSEGAIRHWSAKRVRRLVAEGNSAQFAVDYNRIEGGEMRRIADRARAFCFFPSFDIPRQGKVPAQLIQITSGLPTVVCQEEVEL